MRFIRGAGFERVRVRARARVHEQEMQRDESAERSAGRRDGRSDATRAPGRRRSRPGALGGGRDRGGAAPGRARACGLSLMFFRVPLWLRYAALRADFAPRRGSEKQRLEPGNCAVCGAVSIYAIFNLDRRHHRQQRRRHHRQRRRCRRYRGHVRFANACCTCQRI